VTLEIFYLIFLCRYTVGSYHLKVVQIFKTEIFNKNIVFDLGEHEKMDEDLILTAYLQHFICEMTDVGL